MIALDRVSISSGEVVGQQLLTETQAKAYFKRILIDGKWGQISQEFLAPRQDSGYGIESKTVKAFKKGGKYTLNQHCEIIEFESKTEKK